MIAHSAMSPEDPSTNTNDGPEQVNFPKDLVQLKKPIILNPEPSKYLNSDIVAPRFYNSFNYSLMPKESTSVELALGITSANPGEGKTLVASNLAVSLAIANRRETVIVDLNVRNPQLHSIFGAPLGPGLVEALNEREIQVTHTAIRNLYVLTAGSPRSNPLGVESLMGTESRTKSGAVPKASIKLEHLAAFRDVIYSLKERFDFMIFDLPSILEHQFPILFMNHLDGLMVVVDAKKTKQADIDRLFQRLNQKQVLGFVFNRIDEGYRREGGGK
jgi:Mrp family chromosome partitioning ATPase